MRHSILALALLPLIGVANAHASAPMTGQQPVTMPADTRLVLFNFDPNATYTVLARPNTITDIQLSPDEGLVTFALGDTVNWISAKTDGQGAHIFVKPIRPDLFTSGTLVTTKRTYQLTLRSVSDRARWYQRVSWNYPDMLIFQNLSAGRISAPASDANLIPASFVTTAANVSPAVGGQGSAGGSGYEKLNFEYQISGKAAFRPSQVFDDGRFTWIKMDARSQEMPAVFMLDNNGDPEIVNFVTKGDYIMVQRLAAGFLLKLGRDEVRIQKKS
ncbi:TrbG/VirB9 family P-type conjugative transfer protein [Crenobacter sp. SG2305]|uniref:TrbG/VirB9 family P-type conjugative transfer protein n=1 Tax=Crenobacter oryzisoli TaxID=3056844 RepID=UPI0025AB5211|nr:TrbG/VirB9 family P-type conjugative transfer protein [Crenobacter sp. SG2305]MDN0082482.1 TrbG/VirB9 family P-type conjugative transfer protein [Crenobacter sp. SG2305]